MKLQSNREKATIPASRWLAYATAGLATAAATAPTVEAEIHYFSPVHIHVTGSNAQTWRVPLAGGVRLVFNRITASAPSQGNIYSDGIGVARDAAVHSVRAYQDFFFYASKLQLGSNVSAGPFFSSFANLIGPDLGQFTPPGIGFAGFKFDVGNGVQYGWVRLRTNKTRQAKGNITVLDYAFADPGEPIVAGQESENQDVMRLPAEESLGALALGAVGLSAWRASQRKKMIDGKPAK